MEDLERVQARLDNIRTVEPILSALRTISLGSWQAALRKSTSVRRYGERLTAMLPLLVPHLPATRRAGPAVRRARGVSPAAPERIVLLVIGSERGLCGRFNAVAVERAERHLADGETVGTQVDLMALGTRVHRILRRNQLPVTWSGALSVTALPPYRLAFDLTRQWLAGYEEQELDAVDLVYNAYRGSARYEPTTVRLIPPQLPSDDRGPAPSEPLDHTRDRPWSAPIIETDPLGLYARVAEQRTAVSLYGVLLDSAAAEHAARFQLLEKATQNAERLIDELTLVVQTARQQEITQEVQELAASAGLTGPR
jgi:F-type H+-transporting ATPase subunit gamma